MTNIYKELYAEKKSLIDAYHSTESEAEKNSIREKFRAFKEKVLNSGETFAKYFWVYADAMERGNDYIDFSEPVEKEKVFEIVRNLKALGFRHFTISSTWSGAIENAWLFNQNGCTLNGMVEINSQYQASFGLEGYEKAHALLFTID